MIKNIDYVECPICSKQYKDLSNHIRSYHKMAIKDYYNKYPNYMLICQNTIDKIKKTKSISKDYRSKKAKEQFLKGERKIPKTNGKGLGGFRTDLNHYCRSMWEANFARVLKLNNIEYQYEIKVPLYENNKLVCTYVPDFYIPKTNTYIEIKGKWEQHAEQKINLFKQKGYRLIVIDGKQYEIISKAYRHKIKLWEDRDQNIKNNKQLFELKSDKSNLLPKDKKCPACNKYVNKLHSHFTRQMKDKKHKEIYDKQIELIKSLFYNLQFTKHSNLEEYNVIFTYRLCTSLWKEIFGLTNCKNRANNLLKINNEVKRNENK